jgi:hypothetical protein
VWVRAVVAGEERTTWVDLADLRLPEPSGSAGPVLPAGPSADVPTAAAPRRHRRAADVTAELPAVRPLGLAGRHRAPLVAGRHRAADGETVRPDAAVTGRTALLVRPEVDCLTRPLRLGDRVPQPRSRPAVPRPR